MRGFDEEVIAEFRADGGRAVRAHRLAVARFGEYPAGRAAGTLRRGAWRD